MGLNIQIFLECLLCLTDVHTAASRMGSAVWLLRSWVLEFRIIQSHNVIMKRDNIRNMLSTGFDKVSAH